MPIRYPDKYKDLLVMLKHAITQPIRDEPELAVPEDALMLAADLSYEVLKDVYSTEELGHAIEILIIRMWNRHAEDEARAKAN